MSAWYFRISFVYHYHLGVPAVTELHVGAAPLQTGGVCHELRGAHGLHLPEELHRAARHLPALLQTLSVDNTNILNTFEASDISPRVLSFVSAEHKLVVLDLADLAEVHGAGPEAGGAEGDLLHGELGLGGQPDILGQHHPGHNRASEMSK